MEQNLVFIENGQAVTDSLTVAEVFNKRHSDVIRDVEVQISKLIEADEIEFGKRNFALSNYKSGTREYKKYQLTEDAFALIAMSYVTPEAMKFKIRFMSEFKRLKEQIQKPKALTEKEQRVELLRLSLDHEEKLAEVDNRISRLEENVRIDAFQQNVIQKQIKKRVYKIFENHNQSKLELKKLFPIIHRNLRDAFGVPTYRDIRKLDFDEALAWINSWRPLL